MPGTFRGRTLALQVFNKLYFYNKSKDRPNRLQTILLQGPLSSKPSGTRKGYGSRRAHRSAPALDESATQPLMLKNPELKIRKRNHLKVSAFYV